MTSESPEPGWYPDAAGVSRYWTGSDWGPAKLPPPQKGMGSDFIDKSSPLPERNLSDVAVRPGVGNVAMGIIAMVVGFPMYALAAFLGAMVGGTAGIWVGLIIAAILLYCIGWGAAQNTREEKAARDAQILLGRHLTGKNRKGQ